ncbi:MAG: lectin-like protein [Saprospiraceae bacterium]
MKKIFLLAIVAISFFPNLIQSQCAPFHPGYINLGQLNGHNYYLSIDNAKPTDAQVAAEALGGYLAVIDNEEEDDYLLDFIDELTYIGLNDATTEGIFEWFNGDVVGYTNIDPCGFCTSNSADQDYVVKEPWGAGGWSFSNFWNARKYIVEIPCGTSNSDCAFFAQESVEGLSNLILADKINETADGYELIYERFGIGTRIVTTWEINQMGETVSDTNVEIPFPTGMDFGRFSTLDDYFFMHDVDGLNPQLVKVDFSGNIVWTKTYTVNTTIQNITYTASRDAWEDADGILITGHSGDGPNGLRQPFLIKTDLDGNELWQQNLPNENGFLSLNILSRSSDGGYFLRLTASGFDKIIKIDADGNTDWTYTSPVVDERTIIGESSDGSAFYYTDGDGYFTDELLLIKINTNDGSLAWEQNLGDYFSLTNTSPFGFRIKGAIAADNGGVMFNFTLFGDDSDNTFHKYGLVDASGNLVWGYELPAERGNAHYARFVTSDGGYLFTGGRGIDKKYVWKYAANGWNAPICEGTGGNEFQFTYCPPNMHFVTLPEDDYTLTIDTDTLLATATTNCPDGGLTITQITGPTIEGDSMVFPVNVVDTYIAYEITDACGNSEVCAFTLRVTPEPSQLICPDDITVTATSPTGAVVFYDDPTPISYCGGELHSQDLFNSLPSGSEFPIGTSTVERVYDFNVGPAAFCYIQKSCTFTVTVLPENNTDCPDEINGFTVLGEFEGSKYYISNDVSRPVDAQTVAESNGGYLASISSQEENDFIQQNISDMVYIGLNDYDSEGNLEWFNGEAFTFDNVNPCGFCNENSNEMDFVIMAPWNGEWSFSNFYNNRKYIMEVPCGGNGGGDECSFNVTFDVSNNGNVFGLSEFSEKNGGYQMASNIITTTSGFEMVNYLRDKNDGSEVSIESQSLMVNSAATGLANYWDRENDVFYVAEIQGGTSIELAKYDVSGNEIWSEDVNMSGFDLYNPLRLKAFDDGILIVSNSGPNDFLVAAKTDLFGNLIWKKAINVSAGSGTLGRPYGQTDDSGYYIDYYDGGPFVAKVDAQGNLEWTVNNGTSDPPSEKRTIMGVSGDDSRIYFRRNSFNSFKGFLSVFDTDTGDLSWSFAAGESFAGGSNAYRSRISNAIPANDGGVVVFYSYHLGFAPTTFIHLHERFDADGNLIWSRETPEEVLDFINDKTLAAEDGGFIFAKSFSQNPDWTILSMTSEGYFEPDCGGGTSDDLPDLTISNLTNIPNSGMAGDIVSFNFDLNNVGMITAAGDYDIKMYISTDEAFSVDDLLVGEVPTGDTPVGTIGDVPGAITVPNLTDGNYFLIIFVDALEEIEESVEINNTLVTAFKITSDGGSSCPTSLAGYTLLGEFDGSAYFLSDDVSRPVDAQALAESNGGYLTTISSQEENDFIQQGISELVYIGLNDYDSEGNLEWFNGEAFTFDNIDPCDFCNENSDDQDFVIMAPWNGKWSFSNFWNQRKYIVEIPCSSTLTNPNFNNSLIAQVPNQMDLGELMIERIYPNPAMNFIYTTISSPMEQEVELQIFDARGFLMKSITILLQEGGNVNQISISDLSNGFYSIFILNGQGKNAAKRFVKVRD